MEEQLILKNKSFLLDRARKQIVAGLVVLPILILLFIYFTIVQAPLDMDTLQRFVAGIQENISEGFRDEPLESTFNMLIYLSVPVFLMYMYLANRNERLILTPVGIRYVSPFPESFEFLRPGWGVRWDQVTHARFVKARYGTDVSLSCLILTTRTRRRRLFPGLWVNPVTWEPFTKNMFGLPKKVSISEQFEKIINTDLVDYVRRHISGIQLEIDAGKQQFNLEDNPWSGGMAVALLVLLGYALVDTFILKTEVFAGEPPVEIYTVGGLLVAVAATFLLLRARLPLYICILLPAMVGLAFAAALHPAILRVNQLTDTSGLKVYTYVRQTDNRFLPEDTGTPPLSMHHPSDYWGQFLPGSTHEFELRKGGLGFWQLNETPLREMYHDYYETLRKNRDSQ